MRPQQFRLRWEPSVNSAGPAVADLLPERVYRIPSDLVDPII